MTDKMPKWKLNIFINAITYRIKTEDRSAGILYLSIYLTEDENGNIEYIGVRQLATYKVNPDGSITKKMASGAEYTVSKMTPGTKGGK